MEQDPSDKSTVTPGAPLQRERSNDVFHRAIEILRTKHHVSESLAYEMLVQDAAHARTTVRASAAALIAHSLP